jgi:imidazolonepropionase-like amidohydrolase
MRHRILGGAGLPEDMTGASRSLDGARRRWPLTLGEGESMSKELLIKGGHVVTVDPDLGDLPACDVLVADGLITAVGPDLEPTTTAAEVIEAAGRLVIPGMVDTHRHAC